MNSPPQSFPFGPFPRDNSTNGLGIELRMVRLTPSRANKGRTYKIGIFLFARISADCKRGWRKGATSKNVKNCQKYFRHFSTFSALGKKRQKSSKSVKLFSTLSTTFTRHLFSGPFWGALRIEARKSKLCMLTTRGPAKQVFFSLSLV